MTAASPSSRLSLVLPLLLLLASLGAAGWWVAQSMVTAQTLSESRTVADLADSVGRWASQYGGVHVRTRGGEQRIPGSFLTRSVYAMSDGDADLLRGSTASAEAQRQALWRAEAYHWKNPALIQREVADVVTAAGLRARYRLTARTVLNPDNAANAFELAALDQLQRAPGQTAGASGNPPQEVWRVEGGRLLYARAVVAQPSCLSCHQSAEKAPDFLRTNSQFNGGGGFGYVAGQPAGLISVTVPLPSAWSVVTQNLSPQVWAALAVAALALAGLTRSVIRRGAASPALRGGAAAAPAQSQPAAPAAPSQFPATRFQATTVQEYQDTRPNADTRQP